MRHPGSSSAVFLTVGIAVVLSFASLAPLLLAPGFPVGHDTTAHLTYLYLFDAALAQGQFPVRWVEWIRPGHSQPLFNFYQPGFYYAVQLVHALVPSLLLSAKLTILGAWWAGSAFLFLHLRRLGVWPATLAALLFVRAPYLILDVFVRAALPEFVALACAPAVLWLLDRSLRSPDTRYPLALAAAAAATLLCHLPTVLMFLPVYATYAGCVWLSGACRGRFIARVAAAAALGMGLASFYVVPALFELHLTKIGALTSGYFDYRQHFVEAWQWFRPSWGYGGSEPGPADGMSFQAGLVQWAGVAAGVAATARAVRSGASQHARWLAYWLVIFAAALFMTSAASAVVWSLLPPLAFIQFPWRFLTVVSLASAIVAAHALSSIGRPRVQAVVVLLVAGSLWWQAQGMLKPSHYLPRASMYIDNPGWRYAPDAARLAFIEPGYYPSTVVRLPEDYVERWAITRGTGSVASRSVLDDRLVLQVTSLEGVELTIRSHGFPGWRVLIDGRVTAWRYDPGFSFIVVDVPPGAHTIDAAFGDTPVRAWANRISLLSGALWGVSALGLAVVRIRRGPQETQRIGSRARL
jgi:hypothetical protein